MRRAAILFVCVFLPFLPSALHAAELTVASRVSAVTVFAEAAEVTRRANVEVQAGVTTLLFRDLPASAVENSVRVEGSGSKALEVGSVDTRKVYVKQAGDQGALDESERRRIEGEIAKLKDQRTALEGQIEAANAQKALAENLAQLPVAWGKAGTPASAQPNAAPDWPGLFELIGGKVVQVNDVILQARIKQRQLDEQIEVLEGQLNQQPPEEILRTEVAVMVEAQEPLTANLVIRYQVPQARWAPIYDARLDTGGKDREPGLTVFRRAEVSQDTGEDWKDVALTLSTTRPGGATQAPDLHPLRVQFRPEPKPLPRPAAPYASRSLKAPEAEAPMMAQEGAADAELALQKQDLRERSALIEASAFQAVFQIPGASDIMSGVGARKLLINSETVKPSLKVVTTPRESAAAYLHATFTHDSPAPYLPGRASLYRDGVFAGVTMLKLLPAGQEYELGFGLDDAVKVSRVSVKRAKGETGIISSSNVDEQHFKITVHNLHDRAMPVLVFDQMPYSEDEKILVELLPITAQPFEMNYDDKRGVIAWPLDLKPGEERELAFSYQTTWPSRRDIIIRPGD